ncbi:hypothetical protein P886_4382 [Alteromonadaceae bacterium 2753L.S.0a.02]|nr:hypothetical protein P886_4382 [Alteromonadaceae bacterium 2753L.S.0a.02]
MLAKLLASRVRGCLAAFIACAIVVCFAPVAHALEFYKAQVAVKSQSPSERGKAAQQALAEVLVRMSGSSAAIADPQVKKALGRAISYVEQFQYHPNDDQEQLREGFSELLSLRFSPVAIERLLRQETGLPYWPTNRPATLVWLVEDSAEFGKQLVTSDIAPEVFESLSDASQLRGLPLSFPLMDLQDQTALSPEQVWELDETAILDASHRYAADVILVGRFSQTSSGRILATWQFFHRGDSRIYDSRAERVAELGPQALNPLADYLGARYAIVAQEGGSSALVMQLQGVDSFARYRAAIDYLETMALTSEVLLSAVRGDTILLYLNSDAGVEKFTSAVALDNKMEPVKLLTANADVPVWMQVPQGTAQNPLTYRWR